MNYTVYVGVALKKDELDFLKKGKLPERFYNYYSAIGYNKKGLLDKQHEEIVAYNEETREKVKKQDSKFAGFLASGNVRDAINVILEQIEESDEEPQIHKELADLYGSEALNIQKAMGPYTSGYKGLHPCVIEYEVEAEKVILKTRPFLDGIFDMGNKWNDDFKRELSNLFGEDLINNYKKYMDEGLGYKVLSSVFANDKKVIDKVYQNKSILMDYGKKVLFTNFIVKGEMNDKNVKGYTDYYGESIYDLSKSMKEKLILTSNRVIKC